MGCVQPASTEAPADFKDVNVTVSESREITRSIESKLLDNYSQESSVIKLLILGAAESGKSTILRQLRIIHTGGFSDVEKLEFRYVHLSTNARFMRPLIGHALHRGLCI